MVTNPEIIEAQKCRNILSPKYPVKEKYFTLFNPWNPGGLIMVQKNGYILSYPNLVRVKQWFKMLTRMK